MTTWMAAIWGLSGGLCVEALALHGLIRRARRWSWRKPIPQGLAAYVISVILRAGAGAGLAAAAASSHQVTGGFAAFAIGVAAPLIMEKLSRGVPLTGTLMVAGRSPEQEGTIIGQAMHQQLETAEPIATDTGGATDAS